MEFPHLGQQCALKTCKQLDFLPMKCDACSQIFCKDHVKYTDHSCEQAYKKDNQVPVCPLCNKPVPVPRGQQPDIKVGEHIDRDCQSDPAVKKRNAFVNKCTVKGCKQKEFMEVRCESCRQNFCLKHRHEQDHNCTSHVHGKTSSSSSRQKTSASSKAGQAAIGRNQAKPSGSKPQQTSLSTLGRDLDRERRSRHSTQSVTNKSLQQPTLSEDEALALAIQASLRNKPDTNQTTKEPSKLLTPQEQEDLALAQALAQSEKEEAERQRAQQGRSETKSDCTIS